MSNASADFARAIRNTRDFDTNLESQRLYETACHDAEVEARMASEPKMRKWMIDYEVTVEKYDRRRGRYYTVKREYSDIEWAENPRDAVKYFSPDIEHLLGLKVLSVYHGDGGRPLPESEWK